MAQKFGNTWWGEQWLRSLANVDYDNRLPRGASYAKKGAVKSVKIVGNQIEAKVAGSRPTPYKVHIVVPPFFPEQVERLMDDIVKRPALISKLLNRELDPEMLQIARNLGLKVFPQQWNDFKMACSCPDWAVPCKHLAAVIYMVSREIDNNPFLVFSIHNVDLFEELKKRGIFIDDRKRVEVPPLSTLIKPIKRKTKTADATYSDDKAYGKADFSRLQDVSEALIQLLPDATPFYPSGNFRDKYAAQLGHVGKQAKRLLKGSLSIGTALPCDTELTRRSQPLLLIDGNNQPTVKCDAVTFGTPAELTSALFRLNADHLPDYEPAVAALHQAMLASLQLVAFGMVTPQIIRLDNKRYAIRWLPAMMDARVKRVVSRLAEILPPDLLRVDLPSGGKRKEYPIENQAVELLSIFLGTWISALSKRGDDLFEQMFFEGATYAFDGIAEASLPGGVKVWLDRYYLATGDYRQVITVTECPGETFDVRIGVEPTSQPGEFPIPLADVLAQKQYERQRFGILRDVSLLTSFVPGLDGHINQGANRPIHFSGADFAPFLMNVLPAIRLLDVKIVLPRSLQSLLRPQVSVKLKSNGQEGGGFLNLYDLLSFDWQVALGDHMVSIDEFRRLMRNASRLFKFKENYIYVSDADVEKIQKALTTAKPLSPYEMLQAALSGEYEGAPVTLTAEVENLIRELTSSEEVPLPTQLRAQLRPYQWRGFSWMYRNSRIGFGSVIADDMGLGKTLQVIALLLKCKEEGGIDDRHKALVVIPTGLLINWQMEIEKFAPSLTSGIYHGPTRDIKAFDADVMLTTYGVLRSDADVLRKRKWQVMVIDEAQNIKNPDTAQAKAVKSVPANVRVAMSGTPVENRLSEFWSIMDYTNKGYLGTVKKFKESYANPIQVNNDTRVAEKFRKVTAPFMMRRMKSDKSIISDLPDKIEQNQFVQLTKQQAALYQRTTQAAMEEIEGYAGTDSQTLFKRQGLVLQMILALKQICNHPAQFLKNGQFDATLSGKTELLLELLDSITQAGEKVLVFTQFKEMGDLLRRFIAERFGEEPMFYHGGCGVKEREEMVRRFQHDRADKIFILSLKAAGTGLNLTAASHVVHYDLWWNPAVEAQATDRAYRIGQQKNVMVHRFICKDTFEERIDEMIQRKKHLADMTVASGENWIGKLSNKELRELFE
ncbi:MAG: SWIM zinc finger family protein [Mediterranea sp.]|jgi:uncharacterized Zn finger protein/superfamily II DNA or RNA helicase|nr:SWIM zinc finger family protein [Mediterranea sp.]